MFHDDGDDDDNDDGDDDDDDDDDDGDDDDDDDGDDDDDDDEDGDGDDDDDGNNGGVEDDDGGDISHVYAYGSKTVLDQAKTKTGCSGCCVRWRYEHAKGICPIHLNATGNTLHYL